MQKPVQGFSSGFCGMQYFGADWFLRQNFYKKIK